MFFWTRKRFAKSLMAALCFAWLFWLGLHLECEMEVAEATAAVMAAMQMVTIEKRMVGVEGVTLGEEREGREAQAWSLTRRGLSCGLYTSTALAGEPTPTHLTSVGGSVPFAQGQSGRIVKTRDQTLS